MAICATSLLHNVQHVPLNKASLKRSALTHSHTLVPYGNHIEEASSQTANSRARKGFRRKDQQRRSKPEHFLRKGNHCGQIKQIKKILHVSVSHGHHDHHS